jgi:hypothetical protein
MGGHRPFSGPPSRERPEKCVTEPLTFLATWPIMVAVSTSIARRRGNLHYRVVVAQSILRQQLWREPQGSREVARGRSVQDPHAGHGLLQSLRLVARGPRLQRPHGVRDQDHGRLDTSHRQPEDQRWQVGLPGHVQPGHERFVPGPGLEQQLGQGKDRRGRGQGREELRTRRGKDAHRGKTRADGP